MPRFYIQRDADPDEGCEAVDLCAECWEDRDDPMFLFQASGCPIDRCQEAIDEYVTNPEGDIHPPYEETEYECYACRKKLGPEDA